jgi:hypothetical protein
VFVCAPVFVLIGFIWPLAGWPVRIIGIAFPLFLLAYFRKSPATAESAGSPIERQTR